MIRKNELGVERMIRKTSWEWKERAEKTSWEWKEQAALLLDPASGKNELLCCWTLLVERTSLNETEKNTNLRL